MKVDQLAPREREVAEIVYALGEATAVDIGARLSDPISNSAVRSMLRRLQHKHVLRRRRSGRKYVYRPAEREQKEREAALRRIAREYFGGSVTIAAAAMVELAMRSRANDPAAAPAASPARMRTSVSGGR